MISRKNLQTISADQKRLLRAILSFSGAALFLAGSALFVYPAFLESALGLTREIGILLAAMLMLAGVADFLIAQKLFNGNERK